MVRPCFIKNLCVSLLSLRSNCLLISLIFFYFSLTLAASFFCLFCSSIASISILEGLWLGPFPANTSSSEDASGSTKIEHITPLGLSFFSFFTTPGCPSSSTCEELASSDSSSSRGASSELIDSSLSCSGGNFFLIYVCSNIS